MASKAVYLSGPITGQTYKQARYGWRQEFADMLEPGIIPLSPMRHEGHLAEVKGKLEKEYPDNLFSHPKMIVAKDFLDIEMSSVVLVHLRGAKKVSIGTMVEVGYAKKAGKTIITVLGPDDHIHTHPFVMEVSDAVVENLSDAAAIVNSLLSTGV